MKSPRSLLLNKPFTPSYQITRQNQCVPKLGTVQLGNNTSSATYQLSFQLSKPALLHSESKEKADLIGLL